MCLAGKRGKDSDRNIRKRGPLAGCLAIIKESAGLLQRLQTQGKNRCGEDCDETDFEMAFIEKARD